MLTPAGALVGVVVGFAVFRRMIRDREGILQAGEFVIAVMVGGIAAMIIYTVIRDGGAALLRRLVTSDAATEATPTPPADAPEPEAEARTARKAPLKAKKAPLKAAARERPLRPRD